MCRLGTQPCLRSFCIIHGYLNILWFNWLLLDNELIVWFDALSPLRVSKSPRGSRGPPLNLRYHSSTFRNQYHLTHAWFVMWGRVGWWSEEVRNVLHPVSEGRTKMKTWWTANMEDGVQNRKESLHHGMRTLQVDEAKSFLSALLIHLFLNSYLILNLSMT